MAEMPMASQEEQAEPTSETISAFRAAHLHGAMPPSVHLRGTSINGGKQDRK